MADSVNVLLMVTEWALPQAEQMEAEATELTERARGLVVKAQALRDLYAVAEQHVPRKPTLVREVA